MRRAAWKASVRSSVVRTGKGLRMSVQVHPLSAPSTLEKLVAPLTEQEFQELLRRRELKLLRKVNDRYAAWLGWEAFRRLIQRGEYSRTSGHIRVAKESLDVPRRNWETDDK